MSTSPFASPEENPYQSPPPGERRGEPALAAPGRLVTQRMIELLAQTRPWVRFLSVLGFIATTLMVGAGLLGGLIGLTSARNGAGPLVLFAYVPLSLMYFFPSLFLWRYAERIGRLQLSESPADLESALEAQRSFWRFIGIAIAIVLALYVVLLVLMVPLMLLREGR